MSQQGYFVTVDTTLEWISSRSIPFLPHANVLEQQPSTRVVFFLESHIWSAEDIAEGAIQKILVNGNENDSAAGHQLAEISIARIRKIFHIVIAVDNQCQRKRPGAIRIPDASLHRKLLGIESPEAR